MSVGLRGYVPADARPTWQVFHAAVRHTALGDYTSDQVAAWAPDAPDLEAWHAARAAAWTMVAAERDVVVGFSDLVARVPVAPTRAQAHSAGEGTGNGEGTGSRESYGKDDGLLDMLFVHPDHGGRGVARALVGAVVQEARRRGLRRVHTRASITARPAFERFGFVADRENPAVWVRGQRFTNYDMHLDL